MKLLSDFFKAVYFLWIFVPMENKIYLCTEFNLIRVEMSKNLEIIKRYKLEIIGGAVGVLGGFLYWRFVGCSSGSCPITSSPTMSMLWGGIMGGLILSMFKKDKK